MYWLRAGGPNLEFRQSTDISLLGTFDLSLPDQVLPGPGHIALLIARNTVEGYAIILLIIVLGTIADGATETTLDYTFTILNNIIILVVPKVLCNIIATIKQLIIIELTI